MGMAFQIVDDILDFVGDIQVVGKPLMADFASGVFTLPIIYTAKDPRYKKKLEEIIEAGQFSHEELKYVQGWVHESGAMEHSKSWPVVILIELLTTSKPCQTFQPGIISGNW